MINGLIASDGEVRIPIDFFTSSPKAISRRVIRLAIGKLAESMADISFAHMEEVLNMALYSSTGSTVDLPRNLKAKKDYEALVIFDDRKSFDIPPFQYPIAIPGKLYIKELEHGNSLSAGGKTRCFTQRDLVYIRR